MSGDTALPPTERRPLRFKRAPGVCNSITCTYECHGKRCHCGYAAAKAAATAPAPPASKPDAPKSAPAAAPTPRPKSASTAKPPNPDIIYAPGDLPDEPATPDTPNGTPASPICTGADGEPLISLRLANRYFMLLWGALLRGLAPFPEARNSIAKTLDAYARFYPSPFAMG